MDSQTAGQKKRPGFYDAPVRGLSISVLTFGCVCFGLGAFTLVTALTRRCTYTDHSYYTENYPYDRYGNRIYKTTTTTTPRTYTAMCHYSFTYASPGIWSGLMFIASGIVGILAAKRKTTCFIVSMMALSLVTVWVAIMSITVSIMTNVNDRWSSWENAYPVSLLILNGCTALFSLVCVILSLIKFGYACRAVCCNGSAGLPALKNSGPLYQPLPAAAYMQPPMVQPAQAQGGAPMFQHNMAQPIYLVQGHQVIGMLPPTLQQQPGMVHPAAPQVIQAPVTPSPAPTYTDVASPAV